MFLFLNSIYNQKGNVGNFQTIRTAARTFILRKVLIKAMTMSLSYLVGKTVSNRVLVATKKKCRIASLQRNGKSLEELFDLQIGRDVLPRRAMGGESLSE